MSPQVEIRDGRPADKAVILRMWDDAVSWTVDRGQAMQWGSEPISTQSRHRDLVQSWVMGTGLRIAAINGEGVGASVIVQQPPEHIPPVPVSETYLLLLLSDRRRAGLGIGADLVDRAAADARAAGSDLLRVDCWADAPSLVAWYERQGFVKSTTFTVDVRGGWHGQVFEMRL
jgi:GNAT superfamily N-acetyltransferase